jgi:glycosyltransferase involved in cell wall biosynthesis
MLGATADPMRFELTFAGRSPGGLTGWTAVPPLASKELAELLAAQDVYIAPSRNDPCSNALLEALACGLPALYRQSGGHPELVGDAGLPFREDEELREALERLVGELDERRAAISIQPISWVADRYLEVLGLAST